MSQAAPAKPRTAVIACGALAADVRKVLEEELKDPEILVYDHDGRE